MTCKKFENWLASEDAADHHAKPDHVTRHLGRCETCREVYKLDQHLEGTIKKAFIPKDMPDNLVEKINSTIDMQGSNTALPKIKAIGFLAAACFIGILVCIHFYTSPGHIKNLQQLTQSAVSRHLNGNTTMSFDAENMDRALGMFSQKLNFKVILPDFSDRNFILLGGRLCVIGKCKAAYLFYKYDGKICSLFIMDYDRFDFKMADGSRFSNMVKGCRTDVWKKNDQVYTLVY